MSARGGVCFGFDVVSDIPLNYLRHGRGVAGGLRVIERRHDPDPASLGPAVAHWPADGVAPASALHRDGDVSWVWVEDGGWYRVDPAARCIGVPSGVEPVRREERLWGLPSLLMILAAGDLTLHAACLWVDGRAVVVAAPSTYGKSTLAAAAHMSGHHLLAEDLTRVRIGDRVEVLPGPAMVRMRPDAAAQITPAGRSVVLSDGRRRTELDGPGRALSGPVPVAGVVLLDIGERIDLQEVASFEAVRDLWGMGFLGIGDDDGGRLFANVADLVQRVPVWRLSRPLVMEQMPEVIGQIERVVAVRPGGGG